MLHRPVWSAGVNRNAMTVLLMVHPDDGRTRQGLKQPGCRAFTAPQPLGPASLQKSRTLPNEIINKPGPLTDDERAVIQTHTIEGEAMLENVGGVLGEVGKIVRSCHERPDGLGYPDGLVGEAIPVEARIVACCDAFNAMTTDRPYRAALPLTDALEELLAHRGTQFDPDVVDSLVRLHAGARQPDNAKGVPGHGDLART